MKDFHVFISYSRSDDNDFENSTTASPIELILKQLEKANIKTWVDREGKYIGENYMKEIAKGIDNSEMLLFVSSQNSNSSDSYWPIKEVLYAADQKMKIIPLLLDNTPFHEDLKLLFSAKDKRWLFPNTQKTLDDLTDNIQNHISKIAKAEREKAEAEAAEQRRREEEKERIRIEAEEKRRIAKLEKEIDNIKKRIINYVEKQQACMKDLLAKEMDLRPANNRGKECPICKTAIDNFETDYCDVCGWHFVMPEELVSSEMQQWYEDRLYTSQTIWKDRQQKKQLISELTQKISHLTSNEKKLEEKLTDWTNKYNTLVKQMGEQIKVKCDEISQLKTELDDTKEQLSKALQMSSVSSKKEPIAFLLVSEFGEMNVYCLYEGSNIFGSAEADNNQTNYQMLVVSDNNLKPQHFEVTAKKMNKHFTFTVLPTNNSCLIALNSECNYVKGEQRVQINDMIFIGKVCVRIIDNFNKSTKLYE